MSLDFIHAFLEIRDGNSPDRVVVDPVLNQSYIDACRQRGLTDSVRELNIALLNARKKGLLTDHKSKRLGGIQGDEPFRFASEIAARILELQHQVSLDVILCDPQLVVEFDQLASQIAPGYTPFQYRWTALNLRKRSRLKPEQLSRVLPQEGVFLGRLDQLDSTTIPSEQGIYLFHANHETLYIGESENIRSRLRKHLDHSDNKELARWLWENPSSEGQLEIRVLPAGTTKRIRRAVEAELIASRQPRFNISQRPAKKP